MVMAMAMATDMGMKMKRKNSLLNIFSKKTNFWDSYLLKGITDIHSHYLPGVDDGMRTFEESIDALYSMREHGVKRVYLTPHVMADYQKNDTNFLKECFAEFQKQAPTGIELMLAAEYMLDASFLRRMEGELLCLKDNHVLIEMSFLSPSPELKNVIYNLQIRGYHPILAHPERYLFMDKNDYGNLKSLGCKYQMNLMSLSGLYGKRPYDVAWYLLEEGLYDFMGTDIHNYRVFQKSMSRLKLTQREIIQIRDLIAQNEQL